MSQSPKAWIDERTWVTMFRSDVTEKEASELSDMLRAAFNAGMKKMAQEQR